MKNKRDNTFLRAAEIMATRTFERGACRAITEGRNELFGHDSIHHKFFLRLFKPHRRPPAYYRAEPAILSGSEAYRRDRTPRVLALLLADIIFNEAQK